MNFRKRQSGVAVWLDRDVQYENVNKDPDLKKSSDLEPIDRSWERWVLAFLVGVVGIALAVVAGLLAFELFGWIAQDSDNTKAASAGAWASAVGATALALASVWLAVQANKHAREAEQRASEESALTAQRHRREIDVAEERHARELAQANTRLDRQIKAEWYREQARVVAALWVTLDRAAEPIVLLDEALDRHRIAFHVHDHESVEFKTSEEAVTEAYVKWKFRMFEVQTAMTAVVMLADDPKLLDYLTSLEIRVGEHQRAGMAFKNAVMDHGGSAWVSTFMTDINGFRSLQWPMVREIRRLVSSTTATW